MFVESNKYDGYIALACAIAKTRRNEYRKALKNYLRNPNDSAAVARVTYWERKLKGPVTNMSDEDVEALRWQITRELTGRTIIRRKKVMS